jgi:epoxyqueuosine reductase QueG
MFDAQLTEKIRELALNNGAELVGFVNSREYDEKAPNRHKCSDLLEDANSIIILACGRNLNEDRQYITQVEYHSVFSFIYLKPEISIRRKIAVQSVNKTEAFLKEQDYKAIVEWCGWSDTLSFKMASYMAGLGVFGKGDFIVHPEEGPVNILACIATDAKLKPERPLEIDVCKDCLECIKACKFGAFKKNEKGFTWLIEKCRCYDNAYSLDGKGHYGPCNSECIHNCPAGIKPV